MFELFLAIGTVSIIAFFAGMVAMRSRLLLSKKNFVAFSVALILWVVVNYFAITFVTQSFGIWLVRGVMALAVLQTFYFFVFVYSFPNEKPLPRKFRYILSFLAIVSSAFSLTSFVIDKVGVVNEQVETVFAPGIAFFTIVVSIFILSGLVILIRRFIKKQGIERMQIGYTALGFGLMFFCMVTFNFLAVMVAQNTNYIQYGPVFTLPFVLTTAYAMVRYRFLDIRIAIQRGIARLLTFGIIFGFFAYLLLFIERNVEATSERNVSLLIVVVVLVLTVEPLRRWIYRFVDGLFDNQERKRRDALQRIQLVASSTLQFTSLVERLTSELHNVFGVEVHFLLRDEQHGKLAGVTELSLKDPIAGQIVDGKVIITDELPYRIENGEAMLAPLHTWLVSNRISAVLPIGNREDFVGAFMFHDGQGSAPFTTDRVEFLKRFRNQVQFAFASAYAYKLAVERISV